MKIAFDLDGTLSTAPATLGKLAKNLQRAGCDVFVLTAAAGELPKEQRPAEVVRRLNRMGLGFMKAVCLESAEKPDYCRKHNVDILIDDTPFDLTGTVQLIPKK